MIRTYPYFDDLPSEQPISLKNNERVAPTTVGAHRLFLREVIALGKAGKLIVCYTSGPGHAMSV